MHGENLKLNLKLYLL